MQWLVPLGIIFVGALLFLGTRFSASVLRIWLRLIGSWRWQIAEGRITGSTLVPNESGTTERPLSYAPRVTYEYWVDNDKYCADRLDFASQHRRYSRLQAQELSDRYPIGKAVEVFFPRRKPARSVLERTVSLPHGVLVLGLGILCLAWSVLLTVMLLMAALDGFVERFV